MENANEYDASNADILLAYTFDSCASTQPYCPLAKVNEFVSQFLAKRPSRLKHHQSYHADGDSCNESKSRQQSRQLIVKVLQNSVHALACLNHRNSHFVQAM